MVVSLRDLSNVNVVERIKSCEGAGLFVFKSRNSLFCHHFVDVLTSSA